MNKDTPNLPGMLQQRAEKTKTIGKTTEAAREAYEGLPI